MAKNRIKQIVANRIIHEARRNSLEGKRRVPSIGKGFRTSRARWRPKDANDSAVKTTSDKETMRERVKSAMKKVSVSRGETRAGAGRPTSASKAQPFNKAAYNAAHYALHCKHKPIRKRGFRPVSYTHLTLPTICSV